MKCFSGLLIIAHPCNIKNPPYLDTSYSLFVLNDLFEVGKSQGALIIAICVKMFEIGWIEKPETICHPVKVMSLVALKK